MDQSMKNGRSTAPSTSRVDPLTYVKKKEGNIEDCAEKNDGKKPDKLQQESKRTKKENKSCLMEHWHNDRKRQRISGSYEQKEA